MNTCANQFWEGLLLFFTVSLLNTTFSNYDVLLVKVDMLLSSGQLDITVDVIFVTCDFLSFLVVCSFGGEKQVWKELIVFIMIIFFGIQLRILNICIKTALFCGAFLFVILYFVGRNMHMQCILPAAFGSFC